jgi:hemolysin activation/secretion protein
VAGVVVRGGTPAARAFVERAFAPVRVGEPLRLAALRRGLAAVRDFGMWGVRLSAEPAPGGAPGTVVLALDVDTPKPSVFVSVQNLSAPTVGPWSASTSLSLHGLTPFYDHTTIGLFHGLSSNRQQGAALSTDLLLTRGGLSLHGDLSWFRERPDETPPNRDTVGTTRLARVELSRPVLARADTLAVVRAGVEAVNQDVDLTTGEATERDRLRVVYAGVRVDARRGQTSGWGRLTVRKGIEGLGASRPGDSLLSRPAADPQATAVRFDASARRPLGGGAVELRARTQWADRPLLGFEEFTYGGFYGGRGLDPGALQGDRGLALTAEWRGKGRPLPGKWTIAPVAFVDYARAWNEDAYGPARGEALFGGGGARLSWNEQINLELVYAHPLGEPSGVAPDLAGPRLLLTLTAGFDINW